MDLKAIIAFLNKTAWAGEKKSVPIMGAFTLPDVDFNFDGQGDDEIPLLEDFRYSVVGVKQSKYCPKTITEFMSNIEVNDLFRGLLNATESDESIQVKKLVVVEVECLATSKQILVHLGQASFVSPLEILIALQGRLVQPEFAHLAFTYVGNILFRTCVNRMGTTIMVRSENAGNLEVLHIRRIRVICSGVFSPFTTLV